MPPQGRFLTTSQSLECPKAGLAVPSKPNDRPRLEAEDLQRLGRASNSMSESRAATFLDRFLLADDPLLGAKYQQLHRSVPFTGPHSFLGRYLQVARSDSSAKGSPRLASGRRSWWLKGGGGGDTTSALPTLGRREGKGQRESVSVCVRIRGQKE